ncbi:hypothetical protein FOA52_012569 [Chlamydomonas sp. UWO 241]|nr:hypothetical protein FOA52_012569 [Chlamydomonas sp. UWO 241]
MWRQPRSPGLFALSLTLLYFRIASASYLTDTAFPFDPKCSQQHDSGLYTAALQSYTAQDLGDRGSGMRVCLSVQVQDAAVCTARAAQLKTPTRCCSSDLQRLEIYPDPECLAAISGVLVRARSDADYTFADEMLWGYEGRDGGKIIIRVGPFNLSSAEAEGYQVCFELADPCGSMRSFSQNKTSWEVALFGAANTDGDSCCPVSLIQSVDNVTTGTGPGTPQGILPALELPPILPPLPPPPLPPMLPGRPPLVESDTCAMSFLGEIYSYELSRGSCVAWAFQLLQGAFGDAEGVNSIPKSVSYECDLDPTPGKPTMLLTIYSSGQDYDQLLAWVRSSAAAYMMQSKLLPGCQDSIISTSACTVGILYTYQRTCQLLKTPMGPIVTSPLPSVVSRVPYEGAEYVLMRATGPTSFGEADALCDSLLGDELRRGHLVSIGSQVEDFIVRNLVLVGRPALGTLPGSFYIDVWMGLTIGTAKGPYIPGVWSDGNPFLYIPFEGSQFVYDNTRQSEYYKGRLGEDSSRFKPDVTAGGGGRGSRIVFEIVEVVEQEADVEAMDALLHTMYGATTATDVLSITDVAVAMAYDERSASLATPLLRELMDKCRVYLQTVFRNVPDVVTQPALLARLCSLPHAAVMAWAQSHSLQVNSENEVVYLLSAWVKAQETAGYPCSAEELKQFVHSVRLADCGPSYQQMIVPALDWFESGFAQLGAFNIAQTFQNAGVGRHAMPVDVPTAWPSKPREKLPTCDAVVAFQVDAEKLEVLDAAGTKRIEVGSIFVNGFWMAAYLECETALVGVMLGCFAYVDADKMAMPWPGQAAVALSCSIEVGDARGSGLDGIIEGSFSWGCSDMLVSASAAVSKLVAPHLDGGQLKGKITFSDVDLRRRRASRRA